MFVHIGLPKCASTSLQQSFAAMDDVFFLGCNPKADPGSYYNREIGFFFEKELRLGSDDEFAARKSEVASFLRSKDIECLGKCILSYENLSLRLTPFDVPTSVKYGRLSEILPQPAKILLVHRPLRPFLISLYKNYLQLGYCQSLEYFCSEIVSTGADGILGDVDLSLQHDRLVQHFSREDITFFDLSELSSSLNAFFSCFNISISALNVQNEGLHNGHIFAAIEYNKLNNRLDDHLNWLELHRIHSRYDIPDDQLFSASLYRHSLNAALSEVNICEKSMQYISDFPWPQDILLVEERNMAFLNKAL